MIGGEGAMGHAPAAPADEEPLYVNAKQVLFSFCVLYANVFLLLCLFVLVILSVNHMNSSYSYVYVVLVPSYLETPCCSCQVGGVEPHGQDPQGMLSLQLPFQTVDFYSGNSMEVAFV